MKRFTPPFPLRRVRVLFALVLAIALFPALPAAAYNLRETTVISGGTMVSVYAGTRNGAGPENASESPGDIRQVNLFRTPGWLEFTSNITSSQIIDRGAVPVSYAVTGGIEGVSWDAATGTLTLDNASGAAITIEGPEIDAAALTAYDSGASPTINRDIPNLTYYKRYDLLSGGGKDEDESAAPDIREYSAVQDVVTVRIEGENFFNYIRLSGNVKVIFTGGGTLTLDAGDERNDDAPEPDSDSTRRPAARALSSLPTIGRAGSMKGSETADALRSDGTVRVTVEEYEYHLPDIDLNGIQIVTGGTIQNSTPVKGESYFTFDGETAPADESRRMDAAPEDAENTGTLCYDGEQYDIVYNNAMTAFYVIIGSDYYDISGSVTVRTPVESYIGTDGVPARKVVLRGSADAAAARNQSTSPSTQKLILDGRAIVCRKYNINGENYFKLRDLAYLLTGTPSAFSVEYDAARKMIVIVTGAEYHPNGSELDAGPETGSVASPTLQSIQIDGRMIGNLTVYSVDGNNYFKLRELSALLGFGVDYIASDNAAVVRSDPAAPAGVARYIVNNTGTDTTVTNAQYNGYFKEGSAEAGVRAILAAGGFHLNGAALPATEEELRELWPDGWEIDGETMLKQDGTGKYTVGSAIYGTYAEAAYALVRGLPDGLEVALADDDGDGFADRIESGGNGAANAEDPTENDNETKLRGE